MKTRFLLLVLSTILLAGTASADDFAPTPMNIILVESIDGEPLDRIDAKQYLGIDQDVQDDDVLVDSLVQAARLQVEAATGLALSGRRLRLVLDGFPSGYVLPLPAPPLRSVEAVRYRDTSGTLITLDPGDYDVIADALPGAIYSRYGWPATDLRPGAVEVEFSCGYDPTDEIGKPPEPLRMAIRYLASHYFDNRESVAVGTIATKMPMTVQSLCGPHRVFYRLPA